MVRGFHAELMNAWNRGSGEAFAAAFAEDGDLIGLMGNTSRAEKKLTRFISSSLTHISRALALSAKSPAFDS
jgi:uncharacterized protein (TIGR02246 family)